MSISSNSLFHFTNKKSTIINILKDGIAPAYCLEDFSFNTRDKRFAIPLISFCDLPLSEVKDHIKKYGTYAIAFSLDWGKRNQLNPVFYVDKKSKIAGELEELEKIIINRSFSDFMHKYKKGEDHSKALFSLFNVIFNTKPFSGNLIRKNKDYGFYKFYNEREWRFLPNVDTTKDALFMDLTEYKRYRKKFPIKPLLHHYSLKFTCDDIKYIVIKNENEIPSILETLHETPGLGKSYKDIEILGTKILTTKQITEDF